MDPLKNSLKNSCEATSCKNFGFIVLESLHRFLGGDAVPRSCHCSTLRQTPDNTVYPTIKKTTDIILKQQITWYKNI